MTEEDRKQWERELEPAMVRYRGVLDMAFTASITLGALLVMAGIILTLVTGR